MSDSEASSPDLLDQYFRAGPSGDEFNSDLPNNIIIEEYDVIDHFIDYRFPMSCGEKVIGDNSDYPDTPSECSESSILDISKRKPESSQQINAAKSTSWCIHRELYKREIGLYDKRAKWSTKFYQSEVAVQKLKPTKRLGSHLQCVKYLDFNDTGDILASGSIDYRLCLWDWARGKCILNYETLDNLNIIHPKFLKTQGGNCIVSAGLNGFVILSTMNNSDVMTSNVIAYHDEKCNTVAVNPEVPYVVLSCGDDGIVMNIDIRESTCAIDKVKNLLQVKTTRGKNLSIYNIDMNPVNPFEFIINGSDETVRMYDKRKISDKPLKTFTRLRDPECDYDDNSGSTLFITTAFYNYCGSEILASYSFDSIYLFDVNGPPKSYIHKYSGHVNEWNFRGAKFYGPRSEYVVSGSDCRSIFIWDKKTEAIVRNKKQTVTAVEGHPHMPTLAIGGARNYVKIWEPLKTGKKPSKKKLEKRLEKNRNRSISMPPI